MPGRKPLMSDEEIVKRLSGHGPVDLKTASQILGLKYSTTHSYLSRLTEKNYLDRVLDKWVVNGDIVVSLDLGRRALPLVNLPAGNRELVNLLHFARIINETELESNGLPGSFVAQRIQKVPVNIVKLLEQALLHSKLGRTINTDIINANRMELTDLVTTLENYIKFLKQILAIDSLKADSPNFGNWNGDPAWETQCKSVAYAINKLVGQEKYQNLDNSPKESELPEV